MNLKQKLACHYKAFDRSTLEPDPLQFLHLFEDEKDIEATWFIASVFAYGSVTQINNTLNEIMKLMSNDPYDFIMKFKYEKDSKVFNGLKHRFYTGTDIVRFFQLMIAAYKEYGSLKNLFLSGFDS